MINILWISLLFLALTLLYLFEGYYISLEEINNDEINEEKNKLVKFFLKNIVRAKNTMIILRIFLIVIIYSLNIFIFQTFGLELALLIAFFSSIALILIVFYFPKAMSNNAPNKYLRRFSWLIVPFYWLLYIFTSLFLFQKKTLSKAMNVANEEVVSEEDLIDTIEDALEDGTISKKEKDMIIDVMEFDSILVTDCMIPRTKIVGINLGDSLELIKKKYLETGFSRLPVYTDSLDNIIGILNYKDFMNFCIMGNKTKIQDIISTPLNVSEFEHIKDVLSLLQKYKKHIAIIKDEFGGTLGLITLEDIIEELVGEIYDEHDKVVDSIKILEDKSLEVKGDATLEMLIEYFPQDDYELKTELEENDFITLNGYLLEKFGNFPKVEDRLNIFGWEFIIKQVSDLKIELVLIKQITKE
ncbi:MAG: hemolysin family protein [Acholeplasmatales bacterium]|jgi:CBS domain containing-hemolysin-like protein|nr:hemolysin family protein [Acholeplasmatales bacterium]